MRRPICVLAAAASSGSACRMRARTSSPCSSAPSCSSTAAPGSSTSRYCARPSENSTASKCPVGSDRPRMPILLPVLVRRSMRETTVAATLPAVAPDFTAPVNSAHDCTRSRFKRRRIVVERMARQEEADRVVFLLQLLLRQPRLDCGKDQRRRVGGRAEQAVLAGGLGLHDGSGRPRGLRRRRQRCARGWARCIECAGGGQAFDHPLVQRLRRHARGEVGKRGERHARRAPRRSFPPPQAPRPSAPRAHSRSSRWRHRTPRRSG